MDELDTGSLEEELERFRSEKETIRELVGRIGGATSNRRDRILNSIEFRLNEVSRRIRGIEKRLR